MSFQDKKRITVRLKCPNPLFEEWLISWKEQAIAKESKMQHIFNHALQSLRKYPLPLESGRDCKILKGFGDKLCKMLDDKLKEHKTNESLKNMNNIHPINTDIVAIAKNSNKQNLNESTTNTYIPKYGSGSYAILVILYKKSLEPNYPGFLTKSQVIEHGNVLANSSFTKPDPGSRYTAWSSMKTLISKNLVLRVSHPPKFSLTQEGEKLARKLYENSDKDENTEKNTNDYYKIDQISSALVSNKYLTEKSISQKSFDFTTENKDINMTITNNCKLYDVDIPDEFTDELLRNTWVSDNDTFSLDRNIDNYHNIPNMDLGVKNQYLNRYGKSDMDIRINTSEQPGKNRVHDDDFLSGGFLRTREYSGKSEPISLRADGKSTFQRFYSTDSMSSIKTVTNTSTKNKENSLKRFASGSSVTSTISTVSVVEHFIMVPNSFDIILYLDNHETSRSSNSQNDEILVSLTKQGIKHEVRDLKVGDFLWICREKNTKKELVLPYIIERKRMDDFANSIKDKRYYEQKFRLKKSGIENVIYLVESHGNNQHVGLPLQSLYQAASNTAIQDNFFIKFTENTKETVDYLVNFSRMLVKMFKSKTLASCSKDDTQPVDINDDLVSLITFKELNTSSVKNKRMTVTELFVKMLIQIKGVSVEGALAIAQLYPTPILLRRMFQENTGNQGEKLLAGIKYGKYGKTIGGVLSKTIYQAFNKTQY